MEEIKLTDDEIKEVLEETDRIDSIMIEALSDEKEELVYLDSNGDIQVSNEFAIQMQAYEMIKEEYLTLEKVVKEKLEELFLQKNIKNTVTKNGLALKYTAETVRVGLDTSRIKKERPEIYTDFQKISNVSSSVSIKRVE